MELIIHLNVYLCIVVAQKHVGMGLNLYVFLVRMYMNLYHAYKTPKNIDILS